MSKLSNSLVALSIIRANVFQYQVKLLIWLRMSIKLPEATPKTIKLVIQRNAVFAYPEYLIATKVLRLS